MSGGASRLDPIAAFFAAGTDVAREYFEQCVLFSGFVVIGFIGFPRS
jgi:hypothetical protein